MRAVLKTLKTPRSLLIIASVAALVFVFSVWLPNLRLISIVAMSDASLIDKIALPISLLSSIATNFTVLSAISTIAIAALAGINIALIAELARTGRVFARGAAAGASGIISGTLGMGCAACGSLFLTALAGTAIGTGALAFLPLGGGEFGIIGVLLLGYATYLLSKQITQTTCEIITH